jgi:hypothetical protein
MHKFFNIWQMAPASGDLQNIEVSKLATFCQLSAAVSRGGGCCPYPAFLTR